MGRMKDFDIRIRNGGDDAAAAVNEYVAELELENERLRLVPRWIPVTERLPEAKTSVLAHSTESGVLLAAHWDGGWRVLSAAGIIRYDGVTHWMPWPAPPTESK
jgi:hypothetical protein